MQNLKHIFSELHYRLLRPIAEGGMGAVFEAEQLGAGDFRKTVAIKLILEELSFFDHFQANFVGEARLVADLIHSNIVQTYHLGEISGQYFIVMEYVNGFNLEEFIEAHRQQVRAIPVDIAVFIASRVCRGLHYAHSKMGVDGRPLGIVHRDINPKNIMISHQGDVKITDFGIAKALDLMYCEEGEEVAGKDGYLSPEQVRCEITDHRADIFAVGIVLAEMLLGLNVFESESPEDSRRKVLEVDLPAFSRMRPEVDATLDSILRRALARDREERFESAAALLAELERFIYGEGYGPTSEKLATYIRSAFPPRASPKAEEIPS